MIGSVVHSFTRFGLYVALVSASTVAADMPTATDLEVSQTVSMVPVSVADIFFVIPVGTGVPPDPGETGGFTIQGVDADADGIRDDVERKISLRYPDNPTARAHSYLVAMNYQRMIENPASRQVQLETYQALFQAQDCLERALPAGEEKGGDLILPWVLDTYPRSYAYIAARGVLGGEVLPVAAGCP